MNTEHLNTIPFSPVSKTLRPDGMKSSVDQVHELSL